MVFAPASAVILLAVGVLFVIGAVMLGMGRAAGRRSAFAEATCRQCGAPARRDALYCARCGARF